MIPSTQDLGPVSPISENRASWPMSRHRLLSDALRYFVHANIALSNRIEPSTIKRTAAYKRYREAGAALLQLNPKCVLDVGAGKQWPFSPALKGRNMTLIGFDIDSAEMTENALL